MVIKLADDGRVSAHATRPGGERVPTRNATRRGGHTRGRNAVRSVTVWALWPHAESVAYSGTRGQVPRYACHGGRVDRGSAACLSIGSVRVDRAVVEQVLNAIQPAGIQAALTTMDETLHDDETKRQAVALALENTRYEARRAQRQFDAIDPENRLVAGELERRWNQSLEHVSDLESRVLTLREQSAPLSGQEQERLLELGGDLRLMLASRTASTTAFCTTDSCK